MSNKEQVMLDEKTALILELKNEAVEVRNKTKDINVEYCDKYNYMIGCAVGAIALGFVCAHLFKE